MTLTAPHSSEAGRSLHARITRVSADLATSLHALLGSTLHQPPSAQEIGERSGLNRVFCHRVATALKRGDLLASLHQMPGPEPLRRLVAAVRCDGPCQEACNGALAAIDAFESLIRTVGGDRSGLDAIISSWIPAARARFENDAKQLVYRGMRQIKGIAAYTMLSTVIAHPSSRGSRLDFIAIHGYFGLRCIRPEARLKLAVRSAVGNAPESVALTLRGVPVRDDPRGAILDRFCRADSIKISVEGFDTDLMYSLNWGENIGMESSNDIVLADQYQNSLRRWRAPDDERPLAGITNEINVPSRVFLSDIILHKDVYPDWVMNVRVLETGELGRALANDPRRDLDIISVQESIEPMGTGIHRYRVESVSQYMELLDYAFSCVGWDPAEFRAYRARIEYPIFGSQVQHRWEVPQRASSDG